MTVIEPWATMIAVGIKRVETRSWPCPPAMIGDRLAIHAGKRKPTYTTFDGHIGACDVYVNGHGRDRHWEMENVTTGETHRLTFGAVVATCRVIACVPTEQVGFRLRYDTFVDVGDRLLLPIAEKPYGDYGRDRFAWVLGDVERLDPPIPAGGKQGIWYWNDERVSA